MIRIGDIDVEAVHYCERFLELLIDLEALLPTRRFFNVVMDDCHLVTRCHLSMLNQRTEGKLFSQVSVFTFSVFHLRFFKMRLELCKRTKERISIVHAVLNNKARSEFRGPSFLRRSSVPDLLFSVGSSGDKANIATFAGVFSKGA